MLYLEDYLEMIEHLPQELRDRFTEMREMDLTVQNCMDSLEKRSRTFFSQCKRNELQNPAADIEFQNLRKDYYKMLEDADEKVALATTMHELVERYMLRLDSELFKFRCELEADNKGITEILEKRSLELDGGSSIGTIGNQKENRYFGAIAGNNHSSSQSIEVPRYRQKPEKRRDSTGSTPVVEKRPNLGPNTSLIPTTPVPCALAVRPTTPNLPTHHHMIIPSPSPAPSVSYSNIQHLGAGNAIAAAASQAIVATHKMQQGRRTASFKSSIEAIHNTSGVHEQLMIGKELAGATHSAIQAVEREGSNLHGQRKHKKKISTLPTNSSTPVPSVIPLASTSTSTSTSITAQFSSTNSLIEPPASRLYENGVGVDPTTDGDWPYDPNEPRYCICNQVSYGDMVACDNEACPLEWFHYSCVGITQPPKGKWFCPKCTASMRRRGNRKN